MTAATAETGVKRRSSRLRFLRCFTAADDEESCSPAFEDDDVIETSGGGFGRLSELRPSSPVRPRRKKRYWVFSGVVESDSFREKKHLRRKRSYAQFNESNNKLCRKQDNLYTKNSNKDMESDTVVEGSSSASSLSTSMMTSSEASTSSSSSLSSSRSLNSSSTCVPKHDTIIDSALCVVVVSVLAVIVWGKLCAIVVCTSTWLCIVFGRPSNLEEQCV